MGTHPIFESDSDCLTEMNVENYCSTRLSIRNERARQFLAEFFGSFILALTGIASAHCIRIAGGSSVHGAIAGGLGVAFGIFASGNVSGGHVNPAVTVGHLVLGRMGNGIIGNIAGTLIYFAAQFSGMLLAAVFNFAVYFNYDNPSLHETAEEKQAMVCLFATCASESLKNNMGSMFLDQVLGSFVLVTTVFSTTDPKNANPPGMAPLLIGLSATSMGLAFGPNSGGAINPTRDLAPRMVASMLYGDVAFTGLPGTNSESFMWIPLLGPLIGGALAALAYTAFVMAHWPKSEYEEKPKPQKA